MRISGSGHERRACRDVCERVFWTESSGSGRQCQRLFVMPLSETSPRTAYTPKAGEVRSLLGVAGVEPDGETRLLSRSCALMYEAFGDGLVQCSDSLSHGDRRHCLIVGSQASLGLADRRSEGGAGSTIPYRSSLDFASGFFRGSTMRQGSLSQEGFRGYSTAKDPLISRRFRSLILCAPL